MFVTTLFYYMLLHQRLQEKYQPFLYIKIQFIFPIEEFMAWAIET